ncbi:protein tyrosine kinase [Thioalkalivibrio denitrificans]|uniref:non-specific protein-tyrosine kinase n=1 Tax=Thioalkalivibrio denitrificans TaxID=108003 RepID=A0A1V3NQK3_9GAMM|nr:XrtA-associated tyrosine autokinase [Thioalkalivibrio denitrificans]OOG27243.1 protein tyrosine kinase [Thioalkalivibrio denitrificans]
MSLIEKAVERLGDMQKEKQPEAPPEQAPQARANHAEPAPEAKGYEAPAPAPADHVHIDLAALRSRGFVTADGERTRTAEEFRVIKRPLLENIFGRGAALVDHGNLIMVTSAHSGEGKTWTAINLAISIAMEMDKTVLLVDADVGRARVHEVLGTPLGPGLIDLLTDDNMDVSDVILRTSVDKLRVIPMGRYHPHSNELLASAEMQRLTEELANRYPDRVVIFDSPPLLMTSEAVVLAGLMGQIVFVIESARTSQTRVKDALGLLDPNKPIGLVLNKTQRALGTDYYGYGSYGYGYHGKAS